MLKIYFSFSHFIIGVEGSLLFLHRGHVNDKTCL